MQTLKHLLDEDLNMVEPQFYGHQSDKQPTARTIFPLQEKQNKIIIKK